MALYIGLALLPFNAILGMLPLLYGLLSAWIFNFKKLTTLPSAKLWGVLALWLVLTTITAQSRGEALLGLANFLPFFAFFLAFSRIIRQFKQLQTLAWLLTVNTTVLVLIGLGQIYGNWATPPWLTAIGSNLVAGGRPEGRMSSMLMYANLFAVWLLMVFPLSLGLLVQSGRRWLQSINFAPLKPPPLLLGLALACALEAIAILLTGSRSAWAIALLIGMAYAVYLGWYWLVGLGVAGSALILWASFGPVGKETLRQIVPRYFWGRLSDEIYPDRYTTALRSTQWQFVWQMFLDRPLTGKGLRNFTPLYREAMNVWMGHPHSFPLMLLGETGIVGLLLMLVTVGLILAEAVFFWLKLGQLTGLRHQGQQILFFSYLIGFFALCLYNLSDVTIFDLRNNAFGWLFLAAIAGVSHNYQEKLRERGEVGPLEWLRGKVRSLPQKIVLGCFHGLTKPHIPHTS